jgi:cbb3-type cytochrome oxidase subunit 3
VLLYAGVIWWVLRSEKNKAEKQAQAQAAIAETRPAAG